MQAQAPRWDAGAVCIYCGSRGLNRIDRYIALCPCCGKVLFEHGDYEDTARRLWEEEQAFKIPLVKRRRGSRKSGRKHHKPPVKRFYPVFDI